MNTYVAINKDALRHNIRTVLGYMKPQSKLMAVVKANAYGHGLIEAARIFVREGAAWLGVSTMEEGIALRQAGLDAPILVFLPPLPDEYEAFVQNRLTATVLSVADIHGLGQTARKMGQPIMCHVYVDTGLGRIGSDDSLLDILDAAAVYAPLHITGVYTHFGPPGSGRMLEAIDDLRQGASVQAFAKLARQALAQAGQAARPIHAAASALFLENRDSHLDIVRIGTLLYGQYPDHIKQRPLALREDTFHLCSRIVAMYTAPKGSPIGYGGEFICRRYTRVATVPVGLSHGVGMAPHSVSSRLRGMIKAWIIRREGRYGGTRYAEQAHLKAGPAPIIGRISMDQCCLDVTDLPDVQIGDEVVLPVRRIAVDASIPRRYISDADGLFSNDKRSSPRQAH